NNNLDGLSTKGKVAYTGDMSAVTQIEWILRINDPANWTNYDVGDNNDDYNDDFYSNGPDYANTCQTFSINPGGYTHGTWTGQRNTQWFECANWESLVIPDETTDVLFDSDDCSNNIELVAGETAECNDLTLQGTDVYSLWGEGDETKKIEIFGDLTIKNDDLLAFDDFDAGTDDGTIILHGDWINQTGTDGFYQGNSLVVFNGNQSQTISSTETETFHEIKIDKASNNLNLQQNITTSNLEFVNGLLSTDAYSIFIDNTSENASSGHNTNSYINGNLRRAATNAGAYDFPVGDASNYELATVDVTSATSLTHLDAHFATADLGPLSIGSLGLVVDGTPLVSVLDAGYWEIEPNTGASVNYDIEVNLAGSSNAAADAEQHAVIKRDDAGSDWELQGSHDNTTQSISGGVVTAQVSSLSGFSQFAIARSNQFPLAVELTDFDASCQHGHVLLEWTTASEENSDYFRIEYAPDARSWKTIDKVLAFGTTNQQQAYQLLLEDVPETGYFRLSEVDTDGTVTSYKPAYINCSNGEQAEFTLAPNPAKTSTNLKAQNASADFYLVRINDMQGRLVKAVSWENPAEQSLMISLSDLPSGMYNVKVFNESEVQYLKFIVK
ncbi:MAG: T9SS type A sorting domain-containing protein, partial [Bacteroidota bacterium]